METLKAYMDFESVAMLGQKTAGSKDPESDWAKA
jgi:hypothetical protein